jgi:hypothetical protein
LEQLHAVGRLFSLTRPPIHSTPSPGTCNLQLSREEQIEQAFFFRSLLERLADNVAMQELLPLIREEILATTKLPMAIDFLLSELTHRGVLAPAMQRLSHYFTPFQAFVVAEAERESGRFDFRVGLEILRQQAEYLAGPATRPGLFMYQFEAICRNRLSYDRGLLAMSQDPYFDEPWQSWILTVRRQIGIVDLSDMVYVRSQFYVLQKSARHEQPPLAADEVLFGEKEGRIAMANRQKDPLLLLAALQRQLAYPAVPRLKPLEDKQNILEQLARRFERLETRLKLLEEEQRGGIDLTRFYGPGPPT